MKARLASRSGDAERLIAHWNGALAELTLSLDSIFASELSRDARLLGLMVAGRRAESSAHLVTR
jgi:hypothetical protein